MKDKLEAEYDGKPAPATQTVSPAKELHLLLCNFNQLKFSTVSPAYI